MKPYLTAFAVLPQRSCAMREFLYRMRTYGLRRGLHSFAYFAATRLKLCVAA
jgi:hypothetical protein